jgi:hypothetical protein
VTLPYTQQGKLGFMTRHPSRRESHSLSIISVSVTRNLSSINRLGCLLMGLPSPSQVDSGVFLVSSYVPVIHNSIHGGVGMSRDLSLHSTGQAWFHDSPSIKARVPICRGLFSNCNSVQVFYAVTRVRLQRGLTRDHPGLPSCTLL